MNFEEQLLKLYANGYERGRDYHTQDKNIRINLVNNIMRRVKEAIKRVCLQTGAEVTEAQLLIEFGLEGDD